jgi:RNA 2',3'-cyclic 3'-phosphodiesterase
MPSRCFLALTLAPEVLDALDAVRGAFVEAAPSWRDEKWVLPELQHVTVKFIGALPDDAVPELVAELATAIEGVGCVSLRPADVRAVPGLRRATMLWAMLEGDLARVSRLHDRADALLASRFEVAADERAFRPHVTLVRARRPRAVPGEALAAAQSALAASSKRAVGFPSVPRLTLFASTLGRHGPRYESIGEIPLLG